MIYGKDGEELSAVYDINGEVLAKAYDIDGEELDIDIPVTPLTWNMSEDYKARVLDALDEIKAYKAENEGSYALCQFNDVHTVFSGNEPNFIDYNKGYKAIDYMIFLGDMVNNSNATQYTNAMAYMAGASASKKIIGMGNHEYQSYSSANGDPEALYRSVMNIEPTYMSGVNALIYYYDDANLGVRFIVLDYFYITKSHADNAHVLDAAQLNWLASALASAGSKDVIICAHSMLNPFTVVRTLAERSSSATIDDQQDIIDVVNAFIDCDTYSVTVDGTVNTYDYSGCTGEFVMYTSGHYHIMGHTDSFGFNMFTCPARKGTSANLEQGFTFYLINPSAKSIKVFEPCSDAEYESHEYTYGGTS